MENTANILNFRADELREISTDPATTREAANALRRIESAVRGVANNLAGRRAAREIESLRAGSATPASSDVLTSPGKCAFPNCDCDGDTPVCVDAPPPTLDQRPMSMFRRASASSAVPTTANVGRVSDAAVSRIRERFLEALRENRRQDAEEEFSLLEGMLRAVSSASSDEDTGTTTRLTCALCREHEATVYTGEHGAICYACAKSAVDLFDHVAARSPAVDDETVKALEYVLREFDSTTGRLGEFAMGEHLRAREERAARVRTLAHSLRRAPEATPLDVDETALSGILRNRAAFIAACKVGAAALVEGFGAMHPTFRSGGAEKLRVLEKLLADLATTPPASETRAEDRRDA